VHILIIGLSSIAQRRVVPALRALKCVDAIDIATRKAAQGRTVEWTDGALFDDYTAALRKSYADVVYVSVVNSEHQKWADRALRHGRHVVVDKPAFLGLREAEEMLDQAARQRVCLAEATVFEYHPQTQLVKDQFAAAGSAPLRLSATLSFPPLDPDNFRYRRGLGGGALWDLGPYAAAVGRVFYADEPRAVACEVLTYGGPDGVDTAFSMLGAYAGGGSVVGHFGFDTVYRNRLEILGSEVGVELDRFFTNVPTVANEIRITSQNAATAVTAPAADAFEAFFAYVFDCIEAGSWNKLTANLHADARLLERLRAAAGVL
jgi:predicted dehydrogenase